MNQQRMSLIALGGVFTLALWLPSANSQQGAVEKDPKTVKVRADVNSLMKELNCTKLEQKFVCTGIWMPYEAFVELAISPDGKNRERLEADLEFLKDYQIIVVGKQIEGDGGLTTYADLTDFEKFVSLKLSTGQEFPRITNPPERVATVAEVYKKNLAAMLGEFGKGLNVLIFSSTAKDGKTVLSATTKGTLILRFREEKGAKTTRLEWRAPLDALNPVPPCAKCQETLSGKWTYCPWCGAKVEAP